MHVHFRLYQSMQIYARASTFGAGIACWLERPTRDRKVASSNPGRGGGEFSTLELTLCADSYSVSRSTPVLPQWHVKAPGHSAKSAGGRLDLNMHTPLTNRSRSGLTMPLTRQCGNLSGNELTCNSPGNTRSQSSQLSEPLWTDPGLKSGISLHELIST